jgi:hypothetical protein
VLEKLLCRYTQVAVFLEAVVEEVFDNGRGAFGDGRAVVLDDAKEGGHGIKVVVWRVAFEKLDYDTPYAPTIL